MFNQKIQTQIGLAAGICGMLIVPAMAMSPIQLSQVNPSPSIFREPPYNRGSAPLPNPSPQNVAPTVLPDLQPPLPEQQQPPSAVVVPLKDGTVTVTLVNETSAGINYQVIGDTNQRSLQGKSNALLQSLKTPTTLTFKRQDGGLLKVTPQASPEPGTLEVRFTETTDLGIDKSTMRIQSTGAVFLN